MPQKKKRAADYRTHVDDADLAACIAGRCREQFCPCLCHTSLKLTHDQMRRPGARIDRASQEEGQGPMKTMNPDPASIFRESYHGGFPKSWSTDAVLAFREAYAVARQQAHGHELGMGDPDEDDAQPLDNEHHDNRNAKPAKHVSRGMLHHACSSCGHSNTIAPPLGYALKKRWEP